MFFATLGLALTLLATIPSAITAQAADQAAKVDHSPLVPITLQLRWLHQFQFAGYYAAREKGFYRDAGFDVTINAGIPGRKPVNEVLAGSAQFGTANSEVLLRRLKGQPLVALTAIFQHSAMALLTKEVAKIYSPHDLRGRKVMSTGDAEILAMLRSEGVDPKEVSLQESSFDFNDLIRGKTDAFTSYLTNEPYFMNKKGVAFTILRPSTYGIDFYSDILFTTEKEIRENPDRVKRFREASLRGWQYAMQHPDEIIDLIRTEYGSKKTIEHLRFEANAMRQLVLPSGVELGHMNPGRWRHMADTFVREGMIDSGYSLQGFIYDPNAPKDPLVFLGPKNIKPYAYYENGKPVGAFIDFYNLLGKVLERPVEVRLYQWADAQNRVQRGEGNALSAMVIDEKRKELYDFTQSIFDFDYMLFSKGQNVAQFDIRDFSNKRIAVRHGGYGLSIIENNHPEAKIVFVETILEGFKLLVKGEIDGVLDENLIGHLTIRENEIQGIKALEKPLAKRTLHIPVPKGNATLLGELNQAISKMKSKGEIKEISQRWLGGPIIFITKNQRNAGLIGAAITLAIVTMLAFLLFINIAKRNRERMVATGRFKALFEQTNTFCMILDPSTPDGVPIIIDANKAAYEAHGYTREEFIGRPVADIDDQEGNRMVLERTQQMLNGENLNVENMHVRKDGTRFPVEVSATRVDIEGGPPLIFTTEHDISGRYKAEEKIKNSLAEKEVLLKEIHHRVKNNLHVISAMLGLQADAEEDAHTLGVLQDSHRRVMLMAQLHESLHRQDDLNSIIASNLLNTLVTNTQASGGRVLEHLSFDVDVDDIPLDVDHANTYGQIVSELISNAQKHGFPNGQHGNIEVSLHQRDGGGTDLIVADDGKGLPKDFDIERSKSLGLKLVRSLAAKYGGKIKINGTGGTRVEINFPENPS